MKRFFLLSLFCTLLCGFSAMAETVTLASWTFESGSSGTNYPANKTNFAATAGTCSESTFYLNGSGSQWNTSKGWAFTAITSMTITLKTTTAIPSGTQITFAADMYYNKASNAPMTGFTLQAKENGGSASTTGLSATSISLSTTSANKSVVYTTQSALASGSTIAIIYTQTGKAGSGQGFVNNITITKENSTTPTTQSYALTIASIENGSVTVSVDDAAVTSGSNVEGGKTVSLNYTANPGYEFSYWNVYRTRIGYYDTGVTMSGNTFTMPNEAVTVNAVFVESTTPDPAVTVTAPTFDVVAGTYIGAQTVKVSNYNSDYQYAYTTDGTDPAFDGALNVTNGSAYDNNNGVAISNSCTLKVIAADQNGNTSSITSAVYTIEASIANTAETAYTVTTAKELIDANSSQLATTNVYVKGTVSKVDKFDDTYSSITYWLDNNTFEVYSGKGLNNSDFTSIDDVKVGAQVVVYGKIKKHNSTYEFDYNNYLVSYVAPAVEKSNATINATYTSPLTAGGDADEFEVTYVGDGVLSVASSAEAVATAAIATVDGTTTVRVTPISAGSAIITISATETENYTAAEKKCNITVNAAPVEPEGTQVTFDLSRDETTTAAADKLEWVNVNVTMTAAKGNASTATNNYYPGTEGKTYNSTRFYGNSTLTFTPAGGITLGTITITATSATYATALANSTWTNATATAQTTAAPYTVTITPANGTSAVSATIGATTGATSVVVNYTGTAQAALSKIELSGNYTTSFTQGDAFSHEGVVVTATYTDATTKDVTTSATFEGYNMSQSGEQTVTVRYTENEVTKTAEYTINVARHMSPAEDGYETVDFTAIAPYKDKTGNETETVADYSGISFDMVFAKPQSSTTPTKYYASGSSVRAYVGNTITITAADNIMGVKINWTDEKGEDTGVQISGIGTKTAVVTFSKTCSFDKITVLYMGVTVTKYQYATYYHATNAYTMPEGLEGITVTGASNNALSLETTYAAGAVVPAGEALVLHATSTLTKNTTFAFDAATTEDQPSATNMLKGTSSADDVTTGGDVYYRLSVGSDNEVGFYWGAQNGAAFKPGANKAYLALSNSNGAGAAPRSFIFGQTDTATAVEDVEAAEEVVKFFENGQILIKKNGVVYNAMGQLVR